MLSVIQWIFTFHLVQALGKRYCKTDTISALREQTWKRENAKK